MECDDSIIKRLNRRDESALQEIRVRYGGLCFQMAFRILDNREDAEECVNDMLMAVWESIPPHLPVSLQAYLLSIVRRLAIDRSRQEHRLKRGGTVYTETLDELSEILPSGEHLESEVEQRELIHTLTAFLDTLNPQARRISMQRYFMAESIQTIASANYMSESAVKMTLARTRRQLMEYLRKEGWL